MRCALVWLALVGCSEHGSRGPIDAMPPPDELPPVEGIVFPDAPLQNPGFPTPTDVLRANVEMTPDNWVDVGPADLSCLGTPSGDAATTVAVALATTVRDFQSGNLVPNAKVAAFPGTSAGTPFAAPVTGDQNAKVTVAIPTGTKRFGFDITAQDHIRTLIFGELVAPGQATQTLPEIRSFSSSTVATLPALIGVAHQAGTGLAVGQAVDCQGRAISNFVATLSVASGLAVHAMGIDTFYFSSTVGLPVRHTQQPTGARDGRFMVIELPPIGSGFVQIWGFPTSAELAAGQLTLIAELPVPVEGDVVISGQHAPRRSP